MDRESTDPVYERISICTEVGALPVNEDRRPPPVGLTERASAPAPSVAATPSAPTPLPASAPPPPTAPPTPPAPTNALVVPEPSPAVVTAPSERPRCVVARAEAFRVRTTETFAYEGRPYRTGTRVEVLARGTLERGRFQSYRVRVVDDGTEGYTFLTPEELATCTPGADGGEAPNSTPPPCIAACIRHHREAYVRCADDCVRGGVRAAECNPECARDYDRCLRANCGIVDPGTTPWFRPDTEAPATTAGATRCTYATYTSFHLRAEPVASRVGAEEVNTNPVVEILQGGELRRGGERLFRVRLQDGSEREGWMFIPLRDLAPGCDR